MSSFLDRFKRVTYSTSYLPEIDGLRFVAIFLVVVTLHITHYIDEKFYGSTLIQGEYWRNLVFEGGHGVSLFFIISGFILSWPFARWRLNGGRPVLLKPYYLRRLTRLEPPYLIALVVFFIADVWLLSKYGFSQLLPHFFASAAYLHTPVYHHFSLILPIAWSLEVEVQFYILAPLFCLVFLIHNRLWRRILLLAVILGGTFYWFDVWGVVHVFVYLNYFFMGLLLADLYCTGTVLIRNETAGWTVGIISLLLFFFVPSIHYLPGYLVKLACMFLVFHTALTNPVMRKIFSVRALTLVGGMCYSIYLLHYAIVSALGYGLMKLGVDVRNHSFIPLFVIGFAGAVLCISALYFLAVEKPFMRWAPFRKNPARVPAPQS